MKNSLKSITFLSIVLFAAITLTSCPSGTDSDNGSNNCSGPAKTKSYGQSCTSSRYGTCPSVDDCNQGSCQSTKNGSVCTKSCTANGDCPTGLYCVQATGSSAKVCTPAATCKTYCDGTLCCNYSQDPNDPTSCKQGRCY